MTHIDGSIPQVLTKRPTFDLALGWSDAEAYIEVIKALLLLHYGATIDTSKRNNLSSRIYISISTLFDLKFMEALSYIKNGKRSKITWLKSS
jgi:hypothetical protein